jgi:hypothetical protein
MLHLRNLLHWEDAYRLKVKGWKKDIQMKNKSRKE